MRAKRPGVTAVSTFTGYYRFDQPDRGADTQTRNQALNPDSTHTEPAPDEGLRRALRDDFDRPVSDFASGLIFGLLLAPGEGTSIID